MKRALWAALAFGSLLAIARLTPAHPRGTGVAFPLSPSRVGMSIDDQFTFTWADSGDLNPTSTITMDWFYTTAIPPPFEQGTVPQDLIGQPIARDILEADAANMLTWRTATIAAGNYWIYSILKDTHEGRPTQSVSFARAPIAIAHAGDALLPAVLIAPPQNPFAVADRSFDIDYEAFDPNGGGRVQLAMMTQRDGSDVELLAADLPAVSAGRWTWDTSEVEEGLYILRARITDSTGESFTAFSRFVVRVDHTLMTFDGGMSNTETETGCSCRSTRGAAR